METERPTLGMSEAAARHVDDGREGPGPADGSAVEASLRRMRRWLIGLTVVVAVIVAVGLVGLTLVGAVVLAGASAIVGTPRTAPAAIESAVRGAYGTQVESVKVIDVRDGSEPFFVPASYRGVTYRLKGAPVAFSAVLPDFGSLDLTGLLPTSGDLRDRLSRPELDALMAAWVKESAKPMGEVHRYDGTVSDTGASQTTTVTVDGTAYATAELWTVGEGRVLADGARVDPTAANVSLVFRLDPKTHAFTYVARETDPGTASTGD